MRDFSTLAYVFASLISGLVGAWLSNKKINHSNLDDDNDRLTRSNRRLTNIVEKKDQKIDELRKRLNRKEEDYIKLEATTTDLQSLIKKLKKGEKKHDN